jgi:hypothetical protein
MPQKGLGFDVNIKNGLMNPKNSLISLYVNGKDSSHWAFLEVLKI